MTAKIRWHHYDLAQHCASLTSCPPLLGVLGVYSQTEMTDLKVLISTLPVKGEESLDLQPSVTPTEP